MRCRGLIALLIWGQSVAAADLGTWGDLWPVKEPDMLTVIMQRLTALEQSGEMGRKMDAFKERVIRNSLRPPAVPGIGRTEKYGSRLFDPSVRLAADIRPERLCVCPDVAAVMANVVRHSEQCHDILCEAEWCTGGALGNFTDTAEILRSGLHCRVSFHDDPAIILDDGQGTRGRIFQCVQPFRFLCYQPDCQCGR